MPQPPVTPHDEVTTQNCTYERPSQNGEYATVSASRSWSALKAEDFLDGDDCLTAKAMLAWLNSELKSRLERIETNNGEMNRVSVKVNEMHTILKRVHGSAHGSALSMGSVCSSSDYEALPFYAGMDRKSSDETGYGAMQSSNSHQRQDLASPSLNRHWLPPLCIEVEDLPNASTSTHAATDRRIKSVSMQTSDESSVDGCRPLVSAPTTPTSLPRKSALRQSLQSNKTSSMASLAFQTGVAPSAASARSWISLKSIERVWNPKMCKTVSEQRMSEIRSKINDHQNIRGKVRSMIWRFLESPYSSFFAYMYAIFLPCLVVFSLVISFWRTVDGCPISGFAAEVLQITFEALFGAELLLRFVVCPDRCMFAQDPMNYVDFISASPLAFRLVIGIMQATSDSNIDAEKVLSKLALFPVLKLLKLTRRFEKIKLLLGAFLIALEALPVLLYTLAVIALFFAALIYFAEPVDNILNLPQALWFVVVTMTTVGYGDITPVTTEGHVVVTVLMVISGLYMAIPIGIVGNAFSTVWEARDRLLLMHRMRDAFLQQGFSEKAVEDLVGFVAGENGLFGIDEFSDLLATMHIHISEQRVCSLMETLDTDQSGSISVNELLRGLFPRDYAEYFDSLTRPSVPNPSRSVSECRGKQSDRRSSSPVQGTHT